MREERRFDGVSYMNEDDGELNIGDMDDLCGVRWNNRKQL